MMRPSAIRLLAAFLVVLAPPLAAQTAVPDDIQANVRARVDAGWAPSLVVGVVDGSGTRYFTYGRTALTGGAPVTERTMYEIGSITKTFTAAVLADMVVRHEVGLDDPAQRYLPDAVHLPTSGDQVITLRLLSAQRSGLPRMPNNFAPADPANPYADYDAAHLYTFLNGLTLSRAPGAAYEYSNLGVGLLGHLLARKDGLSYEAMMRRRVLDPLGMRSTMVTFTPDARARLALGSAFGEPAANWDLDALAGAGAIRSDAEDMARYLAAVMGVVHTPLDSAFRLATTPLFDAGPSLRIGLGWHLRERAGQLTVWHNGGTGGYRSWAGYDPARRVGLVVLTNSQENVDDIGFHMFDAAFPLAPVFSVAALPQATLEEYVGRYALTPQVTIAVTRVADALYAQLTGQPRFRIFPSARDEVFFKVVNAQLSFVRDAGSRVTALVLHQNGANPRAERLP